ncbi:hypothetical protein LX36DRAFT_163752 [Colletotrichum falcatum]|nr:hypothetical protein LX36DRAFT_163752 [Colletotrichum falcatum]
MAAAMAAVSDRQSLTLCAMPELARHGNRICISTLDTLRLPIGVSSGIRESSGTPVRAITNSRHLVTATAVGTIPSAPGELGSSLERHHQHTTIFLVRFNHQKETLSWLLSCRKKPDFRNPPPSSPWRHRNKLQNLFISPGHRISCFVHFFSGTVEKQTCLSVQVQRDWTIPRGQQ